MSRKPKPKPINLAPTARKPTDCADTWELDEESFFPESSFSVALVKPSRKSCIVRHMAKAFALELLDGCSVVIGGLIGLGLFIGLPVYITWQLFGENKVAVLFWVIGLCSIAYGIAASIIRIYKKAREECG